MAKKKKIRILPLEMINILTDENPSVWSEDTLYTDGQADIIKIRQYCQEMQYENSSGLLYALTEWRLHKMVFSFDAELVGILAEADSLDDDLPCEALMQMPFNGIYIRLPEKFMNVKELTTQHVSLKSDLEIDGFFYYVDARYSEMDPEAVLAALVIVFTTGASLSVCFMLDPRKTLREALQEMIVPNEDLMRLSNILVQLVLYLNAENADVEENAEQKDIREAAEKKAKPADDDKPKPDTFRELRRWDVGYRYGAALKKQRKVAPKEEPEEDAEPRKGSHARKRTHARRGHLHHFWVGAKDGTEKRRLIVKWISPVIVNGGKDYENVITIRKIKKERLS